MYIFDLIITDSKNYVYDIMIKSEKMPSCKIHYAPYTKKLSIISENELAGFLHKNIGQLKKILNSKKKETFYKGFQLKIAIRDGKDVDAYNDKNNILVLDKRGSTYKSYVIKESKKDLIRIYTDACCLPGKKRSGYSIIIKYKEDEYQQYSFKSIIKNNCLLELKAAITGLALLQNQKAIRIVTDSQYVRKGLTEWILNWKLNNWLTSSGEKAKNIRMWKLFDSITEGRYIEFEWVKGHSGQFENTLCDLYAKDAAMDV